MFRIKVSYVFVKPSGVRPERTQIPALEATGIGVAKAGTVIWFVLMVGSWVGRESLVNTAFSELPQISTAGFILGLIGLRHVTRRARRLSLL